MRKTLTPGSNQKDRTLISFESKKGWSYGIINDPPAAAIPDSSIAYGENAIVFSNEIVSRTGSRLWTSRKIPPLSGRTGYNATKSDKIITCTTSAFTIYDVGNYFVWPNGSDDDKHDLITRYIDDKNVEVDVDEDVLVLQSNCYLRGKQNIWAFHPVLKKFLHMFGPELWISDVEMNTFTSVLIISRDIPNNEICDCRVFDEFSWVIWNTNGIFKIDCHDDYLAYQINIPVPPEPVTAQAQTSLTSYQYGYIYGAARMVPTTNLDNRLTPLRIDIETGVNAQNSQMQDYNDVWTQNPIGVGTATWQVLIGAALVSPWDTAAQWATVTDGTFQITINSQGPYQVFCNFTGVKTMVDVADVVQSAIRDFFSSATCTFVLDHFKIAPERASFATIAALSSGTTGTDIKDNLVGALGATVTSLALDSPNIVGPFKIPLATAIDTTIPLPQIVGPTSHEVIVDISPAERQWHLTHFPIYRTKDKQGLYKQGISEQQLNDPQEFVWVKDLRICAAFYAYNDAGTVKAVVGQFELADVGCTIGWEDGTTITITGFINFASVSVDSAASTPLMAGAIGGGRVIQASQLGHIVTRISGDSFKSTDVRKTIFWSTGQISYIDEYIDTNSVWVMDSNSRVLQGITIDPIERYFCDSVSDDVLRNRESSLLCATRFLSPLANCNMGLIVPGFMICATRGNSHIEYCQLPTGYEYLAGFFNAGYQFSDEVKGDIQYLLLAPNKFVILCSNMTWHCPTNMSENITISGININVAVLSGFDILDSFIGCFDWGSIQEIENGIFRMLTYETGGIAVRDFNGFSYGPNLLEIPKIGQTSWADSLRNIQKASASIYDGVSGYILWTDVIDAIGTNISTPAASPTEDVTIYYSIVRQLLRVSYADGSQYEIVMNFVGNDASRASSSVILYIDAVTQTLRLSYTNGDVWEITLNYVSATCPLPVPTSPTLYVDQATKTLRVKYPDASVYEVVLNPI